MGLDPQAKMFLDLIKEQNVPPLDQLTVQENRANNQQLIPLSGQPEAVAKVEEIMIPVTGDKIKLRLYTPEGEGPFPVFIYFHGGGWVLGDLEVVDAPLRAVANAAKVIVVSVDYRLAPEHKFPTPPEDCYLATKWVAENIANFNGNPEKMAVGGDSAGGNLATVVSLMAKERGGPFISYQVLVYPATNFSFNTVSHEENGEDYFLTRNSMIWFAKHYIDSKDKEDPYASPLLAPDLSSLPPALIITAEYDPLRDEGEAYVTRLKEAGVPVTLTRYNGMIHGFFWFAGIMDQGRKVINQVAKGLQTHFASQVSRI